VKLTPRKLDALEQEFINTKSHDELGCWAHKHADEIITALREAWAERDLARSEYTELLCSTPLGPDIAREARADEREECAKIADKYDQDECGSNFCYWVARDIRARGKL
jgi:hypothetical protein